MASPVKSSPTSIVIDANVVIALCAREADKLAAAQAKIKEYSENGCHFYAPGVIIGECLFVFCRKLADGVVTATEHGSAVSALVAFMNAVNPPPSGDRGLIQRAEQIRGSLGCSRSADGIYLALADELAKGSNTEIVTFDNGMKSQAANSGIAASVEVLPVT